MNICTSVYFGFQRLIAKAVTNACFKPLRTVHPSCLWVIFRELFQKRIQLCLRSGDFGPPLMTLRSTPAIPVCLLSMSQSFFTGSDDAAFSSSSPWQLKALSTAQIPNPGPVSSASVAWDLLSLLSSPYATNSTKTRSPQVSLRLNASSQGAGRSFLTTSCCLYSVPVSRGDQEPNAKCSAQCGVTQTGYGSKALPAVFELPLLRRVVLLNKMTRWEVLSKDAGDNATEIEKMKDDFPGMFETYTKHTSSVQHILRDLCDKHQVHVDVIKAQSSQAVDLQGVDAIISVGGDGTFLEAASLVSSTPPPETLATTSMTNGSPRGNKDGNGSLSATPIWVFGINTDPSRSEGRLLLSPPSLGSLSHTESLSAVIQKLVDRAYTPIHRRRLRVSIWTPPASSPPQEDKHAELDAMQRQPPGVLIRSNSLSRRLRSITEDEHGLSPVSSSSPPHIKRSEEPSLFSDAGDLCVCDTASVISVCDPGDLRRRCELCGLFKPLTVIPSKALAEALGPLHSPMAPPTIDAVPVQGVNICRTQASANVVGLPSSFHFQRRTLQYRAVNDVLLTSRESHSTCYVELSIDGAAPVRSKNSGVIVCTGSGSTAWAYNVSKISTDNVQRVIDRVIQAQPEELQAFLNAPDAETTARAVNASLMFDPAKPVMRCVIREPIDNRVFSTPITSAYAHRIALRPLSMNACVSLDGLSVVPIQFGEIVLIEVEYEEDALLTAVE